MALDEDGVSVVGDFSEINLNLEKDGRLIRQQLAPAQVLTNRHGWATVVVPLQELAGAADRKRGMGLWRPPYLALSRWRKWRGAWRMQSKINLQAADLAALQGVTMPS